MNKEELDSMYEDGLISDEAYKEILNDINIVEELNNEGAELKEELTKIKKMLTIQDINWIIFNNTSPEFNIGFSL